MERIFDIVISSNRLKWAKSDLTDMFDMHRDYMKSNISINNIQHAIELIQGTVLKKTLYSERLLWSMFEAATSFLKMMKHFLADFLINVDRADPLQSNQERTYFVETVLLWFRAFSAMAGVIFKR